jgi:DNA-directed RNA polymerase subunit RPC12/RpoP
MHLPSITCSVCESQFAPADYATRTGRIAAPPVARPAIVRQPDIYEAPQQEAGFRCPFCHHRGAPVVRSKVSTGGWVLFVLLLCGLCTAFLCWIPLVFMKEEYRACSSCGIKLG